MRSGRTIQSRRPVAPTPSDRNSSARLRWQREPTGGSGSQPAVDVLVVDDEDSVRSSICEILGTAGLTTGEAADGELALEELSRRQVGAMVVDVRMPRLDGVTMLQRLSHPPPTILVSAFVVDEDDRERLSGKVLAYLQKPFRPQELLRLVSDVLGRSGD